MTPSRWDAPDLEPDDPSAPGRPLPTLVSLHFLRTALRRRWIVCALSAALGLFLAAAYLVVVPIPHEAKSVLVLAHDPQVDATRAMATDVSLLTTRVVAAKTIESLGLTISPDDLVESLRASADSADLVTVTLKAPTDAEAVRRLKALTTTYLDFRAEQLTRQSTVVLKGLQDQISEKQGEVRVLEKRIDQLSATGDATEQSDAITQRAGLQGQIETLQQAVYDAGLKNTSLLASSRVIDPAAAVPTGTKRRLVLTLASGLIAGTAIGCGIVLFLAITSDRLRRRFDVATALGVPVTVSVRRITPLRRLWRWIPPLRTVDARRADDRRRLANAIEMALPLPQWGRLAVACIDNAEEVRFAVASAAVDLASRERRVLLMDLTDDGDLDAALARVTPRASANWPIVLRPLGVPALARNLADLGVIGYRDPRNPPSPDLMDVTLVVADLDPSVGADHIAAWADRVIVSVTTGQSSVERVRTAAGLVRAAGLDLQFGVLLRTDITDESSGDAGLDRSRPADTPGGPAQAKPAASPGGSPPSPLLRSTSQAPDAATSSSTQKSGRQ